MSTSDERRRADPGHAEPTDAGPTGTGPTGDELRVLRIDHVGIAVADLDEAIRFYTDVFGMTCVHTESNAEQGVREAMLQVGEDTTGPRIQLLTPATRDAALATFLARHGPGVQQVAYTVADVAAASAALRARGMRVLYDEPREGTAGSRINFVHPQDAGGVLIELVEPAER